MYAERIPPEEPPCDDCYVELMPENAEAVQIFPIVRNQVIAIGDHVIDINIPAVKIVMDLWGVEDQKSCLNKIRAAFHHFLPTQQGSNDAG
jgi:hypothetical protein